MTAKICLEVVQAPNHPFNGTELHLSRVPCVREQITFLVVRPEGRRSVTCQVVGVKHYPTRYRGEDINAQCWVQVAEGLQRLSRIAVVESEAGEDYE